nr:hypothetical protein [Tanacetum cinerariifolium]
MVHDSGVLMAKVGKKGLGAQVLLLWWPSYLVWGARSMEWCPRVDSMRRRLALKGVWRCRVVRGTQRGDEVVWLALELKGGDGDGCGLLGGGEVVWLALEPKGGDGGACRLLGDVGVNVVVRSWC